MQQTTRPMYCPRCKSEYREGFTDCADCHVALVDALPATVPDDAPAAGDLVEILSTADPGLIALVKSILDAEEIPYLAHGEHFSGMHATIPVRFLVSHEDASTARDLLKDLL